MKNVFPRCCGYAESLAVDTTGLAQVAFYSNADPDGTFLYEKLGADLSPADSTALKPTDSTSTACRSSLTIPVRRSWRGRPADPATGVTVVPFRGGSPAGDGVDFRGSFVGGDPHMALTVDTKDELWIVWTGGGAVHAARSRSHGQHFGASVSVPVTGTMYQVSAAGIAGNPGTVEVLVNTGSNLIQQALATRPLRQGDQEAEEGRQEEDRDARSFRRWTTGSACRRRSSRSAAGRSMRIRPGRRRFRQAQERLQRPATSAPRSTSANPYHGLVAVTTSQAKLDARALRADFPIFEQLIHGKPLAFLDSAASSQKPRQMLDEMTSFYSTSYANVHRGVYVLAERATAALEAAREKVRALVNAPDVREIIFVRNATEAINLVAYSWGLSNLGPGDLVVVTELEHHSNFVPWQYIAGRTGAKLAMIPLTDEGELDLSTLDAIAKQGRDQGRGDEPGVELARDDQPGREAQSRGRTTRARSSCVTPRSRHRT